MAFYRGQKVVCIDDVAKTEWPRNGVLVKGRAYIGREVGINVIGEPGLRLYGLELTSEPGTIGFYSLKPFRDNFYRADRFRPIVSRKTDISVFTKLLDDVKQTERARCPRSSS